MSVRFEIRTRVIIYHAIKEYFDAIILSAE